MKKVLSLMLAVAMVVSCISIVSFAVPTEEETVFEVNFAFNLGPAIMDDEANGYTGGEDEDGFKKI